MKKIIMAMMIGLVATSYGVVNVNWHAAAGFYWTATGAALLGDGTGNSTIAQLMYSPDAVKDDINLTKAGVNNDVIWGSLTITENGVLGDWDEYASFPALQNEQRAFTSGYVYALVFQDNNVQFNDWYFYTPMLSLVDITGANPPQGITINTDQTNGNAIDSGATVSQVVPEPATVLLIGVGGVMSLILRRMRTA